MPRDHDRMKLRAGDYAAAFGTPEGQRVLADLARSHFLARPTHQGGDPAETAYREGQRYTVLRILDQLGFAENPDKYLALMQEEDPYAPLD